MNKQEIIEGNKLIAKFMGCVYDELSDTYATGILKLVEPQAFGDEQFSSLLHDYELDYHISWEWLMVVVEAVEVIKDEYQGRFGVHIVSNSCTIQSTNFRSDERTTNPPYYFDSVTLDSKIESTWYAVVRFIEWYNTNKNDKT